MNNPWNVLPEKFLEKLNEFVPENVREKVLHSFSIQKPSTFRANTLKITADDLEKELAKQNIQADRIDWYKDAFILKNAPQRLLAETKWYKEGYLYVQGLSSMIPPLILDVGENEIVLDLTAAPGSKTTQMAMIMKNTGTIVANDKSHVRNFRLKANIAHLGVTNTQVFSLPGEFLWKKYPEYFDKTLLDAPCSMEGRFFTENKKTYRDWTPGKVKQLSEMQKWLLRSAISATRPGGTIVYSTCTLSPEENEEIIDWILKKEGDALALEEISLSGLDYQPGLTHFKNKIYDPRLSKAIRIYPTATMEGFFVVKLKKIKNTVVFD